MENILSKTGRPPVFGKAATERLPSVRLTPERLAMYKIAAEEAGLSIAEWVRSALDAALSGDSLRKKPSKTETNIDRIPADEPKPVEN